jgi:plasmid replication initiation protein
MADFQAIMELGRVDIGYMKRVTNSLLCKVVNVPDERGGYTGFQLFKECTVSQDDSGEWYVEIDAHDKALPLMFEFKTRYFSYHLWNALRLRSSNQLRMYEILKQYEKMGHRILAVDELKSLLGIGKKEYPRYGDLKIWVLDACQQVLAENTDIKYTYEPYGKKGRGGKVLFLKFIIEKNEDYTDQMTLETFIDEHRPASAAEGPEAKAESPYNDRIELMMEAVNNEFTFDETVILSDKMRNCLSYEEFKDAIFCFHYLNDRYNEMRRLDIDNKIKHRFNYIKSLMDKDL